MLCAADPGDSGPSRKRPRVTGDQDQPDRGPDDQPQPIEKVQAPDASPGVRPRAAAFGHARASFVQVDMLFQEDDALALLNNSDSETGETDPMSLSRDQEQSLSRRGSSTFANCACQGRASAQAPHAPMCGGDEVGAGPSARWLRILPSC